MQCSQRRLRALAAAAAVAGLVLAGPTALGASSVVGQAVPGVTPTAPAAATTTIPGQLGFGALHASQTTITVPKGVTPTAITGALSMDQVVTGGKIEILVNGRDAASYPTKLYTPIRVPISRADELADGSIVLKLTYVAPLGLPSTPLSTCLATPPPNLALRKLNLVYTGTESAPTTLAQFFSDSVTQVQVLVPQGATDGLLEAGLDAVAALSARYPDGVPVTLGVAGDAPTTPVAGLRVVRFTSGGTAVATAITDDAGIPTLSISGIGDPLAHAAEALGSPALALANADVTQGLLTQDVTRDVGSKRSFEQLGIPDLSLTSQTPPVVFDIAQDAFGGPRSSLQVRLVGAHTAVTGGNAPPLNVYVDGTLVDSVALTTTSAFDEQFTIPHDMLQASDTVALSLGDIACTDSSGLPVQLSIDSSRSGVTSTADTSPFGLQQFPQAFTGQMQMALRATGPDRVGAAEQAAGLVSALQRAGAGPINIDIVSGAAFLAGHQPGLLIGADDTDSVALQAPLQLTRTRQIDGKSTVFAVDAGTPYAALESVTQNQRAVLLLGGWADDPNGVPSSLLNRLVSRVGGLGWPQLTGDIFVMDPDSAGQSFTSTPREPQKDTPINQGRSLAKYFIGLIVLIALALAVQLVLFARRRRRAAPA